MWPPCKKLAATAIALTAGCANWPPINNQDRRIADGGTARMCHFAALSLFSQFNSFNQPASHLFSPSLLIVLLLPLFPLFAVVNRHFANWISVSFFFPSNSIALSPNCRPAFATHSSARTHFFPPFSQCFAFVVFCFCFVRLASNKQHTRIKEKWCHPTSIIRQWTCRLCVNDGKPFFQIKHFLLTCQ